MSSPMAPMVTPPVDPLVKPPIPGADGWCAIAILSVSLILMAFDVVRPDLNFLTTMGIYTASRMITVPEAAAGFANVGLLSVMALFSVAAGISRTGGMECIIKMTTGSEAHHQLLLIRMMLPVLFASAFLNNTPIVAVMIPMIMSWARRNATSPKPMLICLSYCAILGGTCTLIGTSTNLVIVGFQKEAYPDDPSLANPAIFSIAPYGVAYAAWGFMFLLLFSKVLLGVAHSPAQASELLVGLLVPKGSKLAGQSVAAAGLRHLEDVFLVSITRGGELIHAVGPEMVLQENDILSFAGDLSKVGSVSSQFGLPVVNSERDDVLDAELGLPPTHTCVNLATETASRPGSRASSPRAVNCRVSRGGGLNITRGGPRVSIEMKRLDGEVVPMSPLGLTSIASPFGIVAQPLRFTKCTVRDSSPLVGMSIRDAAFRMRFSAAVVSVYRLQGSDARLSRGSSSLLAANGQHASGSKEQAREGKDKGISNAVANAFRPAVKLVKSDKPPKKESASSGNRVQVEGKLADIVLQGGDELLLDVDTGFNELSPDVVANFDDVQSIIDNTKGYTMAFLVSKPLVGKSVREAGLSGFSGATLTHLDRADGITSLQPVPGDTSLEEGDIVWFTGDVEGLTFLFSFVGLNHLEQGQIKKAGNDDLERRLVQVVVAAYGPLIGRSVRESHFRSKYNAAIVGVHRRGERLKQKIGDIVLQAGDVLLLDAGNQFLEDHSDSNAFSLISEVPESAPMNTSRMWLAMGLFVAMITVQIVQAFVSADEPWINLWTAALLLTSVMVLFRCMTWDQAKAALDWTVYLTIASSFGVSKAISNTGVAENIAWLFMQPSIAIGGEAAILSTLYIVTALLSEILTNNAAAALMFPIAKIAGEALGADPKLIGYSLMLGASSSFISPFGYQTNLMVFNAGGMKFKDLARIGVPLQLWMWVGATIILGFNEQIGVVLGVMLGAAITFSAIIVCFVKVPFCSPFKAACVRAKTAVGSKVSRAAAAPKQWASHGEVWMLMKTDKKAEGIAEE